jgi:hypothetical protein
MQQGFFYDFSNYGIHDRLSDDGITQWHPAFLSLGKTLEECAQKYRGFCKKYRPQPKPEKRNHWGNKLFRTYATGTARSQFYSIYVLCQSGVPRGHC